MYKSNLVAQIDAQVGLFGMAGHSILKIQLFISSSINYSTIILKHLMDAKCYYCRGPINNLRYACCNQTKLYCFKCNLQWCRICNSHPKLLMNTKQSSLRKNQRQPTFSKSTRYCENCERDYPVSDYEFIHEPKCNFYFCYKCIIPFYQQYRKQIALIAKDGVRPELSFQLPCANRCNSEMPECDILAFLQKSCFCCRKKIQNNISYCLNNDTKVMKKCLAQKQKTLSQKQKNKLANMLIKCDGCDSPLTEILASESGERLNVCKQCYQLNKKQEQVIEQKYHRQELLGSKFKESSKEESKISKKEEPKQNKLQIQQDKTNKSALKVNNIENVEEQIAKPLQNGSLKTNSQKSTLESIRQQKSIQSDYHQKNRPNEIAFGLVEEKALQQQSLSFGIDIFHNLTQCSQCFIFMRPDHPIYSLQSSINSALKLKGQEKNNSKQSKQRANQLSQVCQICFNSIKQKILIEAQKKSKEKQQNLQKSRLYRSAMKTEKKVQNKVQPKRDNLFSKLDTNYDLSKISIAKLQNPGSISTREVCSVCGQKVLANRFIKKLKKCYDCESKDIERQQKMSKIEKIVQIVCLKCKTKKQLKESEVGKLGYCKQCYMKIFGL